MKPARISFLLLIAFVNTKAQQSYEILRDSNDIRAIERARIFAADSLKLNVGKNFYAWEIDSLTGYIKAKTVKKMYCYVYAWDVKNNKSPLDGAFQYFGTDEKKAKKFRRKMRRTGYETMLYKTAGTSAAEITSRMLDYSPSSIRFIILHESVHRHRGNNNLPLPYVFEEALCDLVANMYLPDGDTETDFTKPAKIVMTNGKVGELINKAASGEMSLKECNKQMRKALKGADMFQRDRYNYKVNRAYLERYSSYCRHYVLLQKVFLKMKDRQKFFDTVFNLKGTEEEIVKQLEALF